VKAGEGEPRGTRDLTDRSTAAGAAQDGTGQTRSSYDPVHVIRGPFRPVWIDGEKGVALLRKVPHGTNKDGNQYEIVAQDIESQPDH
jgi:hypothetical protein